MYALSKAVCLAVLLSAAIGLSSQAAAQAPPPFQVNKGNVWEGELKQTGKYQGAPCVDLVFKCVFTVTESDGTKFKATLAEKSGTIELTYLVEGDLVLTKAGDETMGYTIKWKGKTTKDLKNTESFAKDIEYKATFTADKFTAGEWKFSIAEVGTTLKGTFEFDRKKTP